MLRGDKMFAKSKEDFAGVSTDLQHYVDIAVGKPSKKGFIEGRQTGMGRIVFPTDQGNYT